MVDTSNGQDLTGIDINRSTKLPLPIEVHERLISFLDGRRSDERATIARCALVCRAWLPFSRYKLLHEVVLHHRRDWDCFKPLIIDPPPVIAPYLEGVRGLIVGPEDEKYLDGDTDRPRIGWGPGQERPWAHLVLSYCAQRMAGLAFIDVKDVDWSRSWVHSRIFSACCRFRALNRLQLRECTFESVAQLERLMYAFPALSDLCISSPHFQRLLTIHPCQETGPRLTRLQLECADAILITLSRWLVDSRSVFTLSQLEWLADLSDPEGLSEAFGNLVQSVGAPLQSLACGLFDEFEVDWSRHVGLRTLDLRVCGESVEQSIRRFGSVFTQTPIPFRCLEELKLRIVWPEGFSTRFSGFYLFEKLDAVLRHPQYRTLQRMTIAIYLRHDDEETFKATNDSYLFRTNPRDPPSNDAPCRSQSSEDALKQTVQDQICRAFDALVSRAIILQVKTVII